MNTGWLPLSLVVWLCLGCAGITPGITAKEEPSLIHLWKTYVHCRESHDPYQMWADSRLLAESAHSIRPQQPSRPLPDIVAQLVSELPSRLSVDPDAMAADCLLRAGQAARVRSRPKLAMAFFRLITGTYPADQYGYYVEQASRMLVEEELVDHPIGRSPEMIRMFDWQHQPLRPEESQGAHPLVDEFRVWRRLDN